MGPSEPARGNSGQCVKHGGGHVERNLPHPGQNEWSCIPSIELHVPNHVVTYPKSPHPTPRDTVHRVHQVMDCTGMEDWHEWTCVGGEWTQCGGRAKIP